MGDAYRGRGGQPSSGHEGDDVIHGGEGFDVLDYSRDERYGATQGIVVTFGEAADLEATQPTTFVRADAPPAFLATGDKDTTVYPRNTRKLAAALRAAGARVEERHYPGVDHAGAVLALSRLFRGKAPLLVDMTAFLKGAV